METNNKSLNMVIIEYVKELEAAGIDDARNNVLMLAEAVLGCTRSKLTALSNDMFDNVFALEQKIQLENLLARRMAKEPLQYIVGETEFMGLPFYVTPDVLIPRQDTEVLVEQTLEHIDEMVEAGLVKDSLDVLDMCTGSGCIAISLAAFLNKKFAGETKINVTAVDISEGALKVVERNAARNGVDDMMTIVKSDLFAQLGNQIGGHLDGNHCCQKFDVIVSNPPYIPSEDCKNLQDEVMHEPLLALDGGDTGFDFYKRLILEGQDYLKENGAMLFEFGITQENLLREMALEYFCEVELYADYSKIPRVIKMKNGK